MKKLLLFFAFLIGIINANAQTMLTAGDLSILGFNSGDAGYEGFTFVCWVPISAGTSIRFIQDGFNSASVSTASGNLAHRKGTLTWTASTALPAGTVISIQNDGVVGDPPIINPGTVSIVDQAGGVSTTFALANTGGRIFAAQGGTNNITIGPSVTFSGTLLYGVYWQGVGTATSWITTGTTGSTTSWLPSDITGFGPAFGSNIQRYEYTGSRTGMTLAQYKAAVNDASNWGAPGGVAGTGTVTGATAFNSTSFSTAAPAATVTSVNSSTANSSYKAGDVISIQVNFSSTVTVTGTPRLQLSTGATNELVNYSSGSGTTALTFNYTVQAGDVSGDLDYLSTTALTLNGGTISNSGTNATLTLAAPGAAGSLGANKNIVIDTEAPTATLVMANTAFAIGQTSLLTITFSEAVTGFTNSDLSIQNGTLTAVASSDGGVTWTATFTPTAGITAVNKVVTLDNTGVADLAGNTGTGTTPSNNYAIDTQRPTATLVLANTALNAGQTSLLTVTFSEAVSGFTNADLTIQHGTLTAVSSSDGGITWTATFTPTAGITAANNTITLDNTGVADLAGNTGTGTTPSNNYAINTQRPTATLVLANTTLNAGQTSLLTITFSEAVTGLTNADLTIQNGTLSAVSSSDGGVTWTATFTPNAGITAANNISSLDNTGVANAAGNTGTGTTPSNNYAIDTQRPTATLVLANTALNAGQTSLLTITFSEAVTGFTNADLTIQHGTLTAVSSSDGGITWTATFTPTAGITAANNTITLDNTGLADLAGNTGTGTTPSNNYAIDTQRPTATLVMANAALGTGQTSLLTVTFSEAVSGFTNADLTIQHGTLTAVSSSDGGITWTATFTPTAGIMAANNAITLDNTGIADAAGNTGAGSTPSNNYSIDTHPAITLSPTTLPAISSGLLYNQTVSASGGTAPYQYTVTTGALPTGLSLSAATGVISGTSITNGTYNFTVTATDGATVPGGPFTGSQAYTLTVTPVISPATLPAGTVGASYGAQTLSTSNGTPPYTYAVTSGALPPGLNLSGNTISGIPTAGGTFTFTITSTDSSTGAGPFSGSKSYSVTTGTPTIIINPSSLPTPSPVVAYNQTLTSSGGTAPYTYAVTGGTLPAGLSLAPDGTFSGTATVLGAYSFTVTSTDSSTGTGPYTKTATYSGTITGPVTTVAPATIPAAKAGVPYSQTITASGANNTPPYTFTKVGIGNLPPGLTIATDGTLSGTPTAVGSYTFQIRATDSSPGPGPYAGSRLYPGFIVSAPTIVAGPSTVPDGTAGLAYSQNIIATGGTAPYTYTVTSGALPAGITLASDGTLSGTTGVTGTFSFTVKATDVTTGAGAPYSGSATCSVTFTAPSIALTPATLPAATAGAAYNQTLTASGGNPVYAYAITAGALPAGMTLSSAGTLSGIPTAGGSFNFTVTVTDGLAFTGSQAYTLTTNAAILAFTGLTLPGGTFGAAYSQSITASGGTPPYTYAVTSGALPAGLTLAANGTISGIPTAGGTFNFIITATDASSGTGPYSVSSAYSIVIGRVNQTLTFADITATYGDAPLTITGTASSGLGVTYTSSNNSVATVTGNTLTIFAAGTATITASQAGNASYNAASDVAKTLTVNARNITVTADNKTKVYGSADPMLTYQVTSGSLVSTDTFSGALTRDAGEAVNTYAIKQGTLALNSNYTLTYSGANLTITPAALLAKADDQTRAYGTANPTFTVSYTGFVHGDKEASLTTKPSVSTAATAASAVGTYPLMVAGAVSPNYSISYSPGTLTITKPVLTITADNKTRNYGAANPAFTITYSGFINGDDVTKLTTPAIAVNNSTATTAPGNYPITVSGAAAANYTFNYVAGTLTIVPLNNTDLSSLTTSAGSLSPAFNTNTSAYNVMVDNAIAYLSLTPTYAATASASLNGTAVPNGSSSFGVPLTVGNTVITLVITAQDGVTKNTYTLNVYRGIAPANITANNLLTPNGDGKNDYWVVKDIQLYPNNKVTVYDRGGRVVFTQKGYSNNWGGTLNNTGAPLTAGTYYYTIDLGVSASQIKGFISIIRSK